MPTERTPPPRPAPHLARWQRHIFAAVTQSGKKSAPPRSVAPLIKRGGPLTPLQRLAIYQRMYRDRTFDSLAEDFPAVLRLLGSPRFTRLCRLYLRVYPSRTFTLRNLGHAFPAFLRRQGYAAASALAAYAWAQVEAFDAGDGKPLGLDALTGPSASRLRLRLAPHVQMGLYSYSVAEYAHQLRDDRALTRSASHTRWQQKKTSRSPSTSGSGPSQEPRYTLVVHRHAGGLFAKRLEPRAARLLRALARGLTLAQACRLALARCPWPLPQQTAFLQNHLAQWMRLGWLCASSSS